MRPWTLMHRHATRHDMMRRWIRANLGKQSQLRRIRGVSTVNNTDENIDYEYLPCFLFQLQFTRREMSAQTNMEMSNSTQSRAVKCPYIQNSAYARPAPPPPRSPKKTVLKGKVWWWWRGRRGGGGKSDLKYFSLMER